MRFWYLLEFCSARKTSLNVLTIFVTFKLHVLWRCIHKSFLFLSPSLYLWIVTGVYFELLLSVFLSIDGITRLKKSVCKFFSSINFETAWFRESLQSFVTFTKLVSHSKNLEIVTLVVSRSKISFIATKSFFTFTFRLGSLTSFIRTHSARRYIVMAVEPVYLKYLL